MVEQGADRTADRRADLEEIAMADAAYGLWPLVVVNTAVFVLFAASFFHPRTGRDWFGDAWRAYAGGTPAFIPRRRRAATSGPQADPRATDSYRHIGGRR
jgi:hypothetical protein